MRKERINEIWGIFFLLLGLYTLASMAFFTPDDLAFFTSHPNKPVANVTGITGAYLAFGLFWVFGSSAFLIPALFLLWAGCFFIQRVPERKLFKFAGLAMSLFAAATIVSISVDDSVRLARAGVLGYLAGTHLLKYFGKLGSYIIAGSCFLLSILLATDFLIYPLVRDLTAEIKNLFRLLWKKARPLTESAVEMAQSMGRTEEEKEPKKAKQARRQPEKPAPMMPDVQLKVKKYDPTINEVAEKLKAEAAKEHAEQLPQKPEKPKRTRSEAESLADGAEDADGKTEKKFEGVIASKPIATYCLPPVDLLKKPALALKPTDDLKANSHILEKTLEEFGISVKVLEVEQGPVITRYELMPAPGVKVNSISALQDDLALALKASSVRLIIPIPGKSAIGVEVPNSVSNTVSLREMIESQAFRSGKSILPLILGKTTSGKPLVVDLTAMPHILIAGSTGSGKTVCVNSIIMGLLYNKTPEELKFVMVDPKMVEMAVYNNIPHMLSPVVTDVRKAARTLNWVVNEMENRYKLFATCGVRNIQSFNDRPVSETVVQETAGVESDNVVPPRLPHIVVVIDELADLMLVAKDKVETAILRLAQLARAVGIHLILATQRPSVDVITGVIKANFPARLSFKVSSKVDSRTVLDTSGADKLLGRGDLLFLQPGDPKPVRGQAPLVTDQEINDVVEFVKKQGNPEFHPEIQNALEGRSSGGSEEKDELFEEAVRVVMETKQASTSNLQRRMRLGYTRAARIIDQMEAEGIVGPAQGAKPREILVSAEDAQFPIP